MKDNNRFSFFLPVEIHKGEDGTEEVMKVKGIASTTDQDSDEEILDPRGFDVSYFLQRGFLNWEHQAKNNPTAIIGEPTKAEITKAGKMYIEGFLYPKSAKAREVYELGKVLEQSGSKRKLGFSIEGKVMERDPLNPKIIKKAKITGCAITPNPKNSFTLMEIVKGEYEGDELPFSTTLDENTEYVLDVVKPNGDRLIVDRNYEIKIEKAMTASNETTQEDLEDDLKDQTEIEKNNSKKINKSLIMSNNRLIFEGNISKSLAYEFIFTHVSTDLEKADKFYDLAKAIEAKNGKDMKQGISSEALEKAFEAVIGAQSEVDKELEKAENIEELNVENTATEELSGIDAEIKKAQDTLAALEAKKSEQETEKPIEKSQADDLGSARESFEDIVKSHMEELTNTLGAKISALGVINKSLLSKMEEMELDFNAKIEAIGSQPVGRKSIQTKGYLEKSEDNEIGRSNANSNGLREVSVSKDKAFIVKSLFDTISYTSDKPEDIKKMKDISDFEAGGTVTQNLIKLAKEAGLDLRQ